MYTDTLNVLLALQDKKGEYSKNIAVVMSSIINNTHNKVYFHIFHDGTLTKENKKKLAEVASAFKADISFYNILLPIAEGDFNAIKYISMGTLYRLDVANQLKNVSKVLYLDGDIVVHLDIAELFSIDMGRFSIIAVKDKGVEINPKLYTLNIPVKLEKYFNAGVILFDLVKIRERYNLLNDCLDIIRKYPKDFFTDQSALNHFLQDDCLLVDEKYNSFPNVNNDNLNKSCIWHFAGGGKPWTVRQYKVDLLYWEYLKYTPWGKNTDQLFELYSKTVAPLEEALLTYPLGSRRKFFRSVIVRVWREIKKIVNQFL